MPSHQYSHPSRSEVSLASSADTEPSQPSNSSSQPLAQSSKKGKSKSGFGRIGRSRSKNDKDELPASRSDASTPVQDDRSVSSGNPGHNKNHFYNTPSKDKDYAMASSTTARPRNRSKEGAAAAAANTTTSAAAGGSRDDPPHDTAKAEHKHRHKNKDHKEKDHKDKDHKDKPAHHAKADNGGLFSSFKSGSRAADIFGRGFFGSKTTRQNSTTEREPVVDDENYVVKVINLPLVEQTRMTRISKRLEESRDKTEFWMPAFPWRAIDYLNYKGCDVEGLYRVPGSGPQIKKWQRRFDEEYDVDLFEQDDLYDINIIGSMLKAWLRELPDELFPKAAQDKIARECADSEEVPQMLIEELSKLSPFNYYLLFAITCHLSLLLAHSEKNKMDYRNLCICFQPCMKIDAFCFKFLVCNWRECWKGCASEAQYIEEEYRLFDVPPPRGLTNTGAIIPASPKQKTSSSTSKNNNNNTNTVKPSSSSGSSVQPIQIVQQSPQGNMSSPLYPPMEISKSIASDHDPEERAVSSSGSSKQSAQSLDPGAGKIRTKRGTVLAPINASPGSIRSISTTLTSDNEHDADGGRSQRKTPSTPPREMRPLSPIKPLSPLGF
ncbi:hypothetical protein TD95_002680 [Thielaviopsis punctulata]|uniref:Rho-GAP domain-containing protein n=1 Tax=Thielaviopsis punctulata TaxID=72032 RepID=A0A0F4ZH34_9PEZI|nr:hypothetical protein TD95_002680 [Thielaviopsis punctulata]